MKDIQQLGISKWPWESYKQFVTAGDDDTVVAATNVRDARLIAAAPELYESLREAVIEMCHAYCDEDVSHRCPMKDGECFVQDWRAVLSKAAGEEGASGELKPCTDLWHDWRLEVRA